MHCKPFSTYIDECTAWVKQRRANFPVETIGVDAHTITAANSPFELRPTSAMKKNGKYSSGAVLIHGLFDCPFSLRDIASQLQQAGIFCRSILLPGHGTHPTDLLTVTHKDWLATLEYGIASLRDEVEHLFLIGYSTGGALSVHHTLHHHNVNGIILLAPALKIRAPVSAAAQWPMLAKYLSQKDKWLCREKETDYTKYESVPLHSVFELQHLITKINETEGRVNCPLMVVMSHDDETVCAPTAIDFFAKQQNNKNNFLLYTRNNNFTAHHQIEIRRASYPENCIHHISHVAIPFAPSNPHYGQHGDYLGYCQQPAMEAYYGAYNRFQTNLYNYIHKMKLIKNRRLGLTYNPDFDYMTKRIIAWLSNIAAG